MSGLHTTLQHAHLHLAGEPLPTSNALVAAAAETMAPPPALFKDSDVTDFGTILNFTASAEPYSHGLNGVGQPLNFAFVNILIISFSALMAITLAYRWIHMSKSYLRRLMAMGRKWEDQRYWMYNHSHFWPRIKRHLTYAPLFRNRHNKEIQLSKSVSIGTLPSRYHTVLLVSYLLSNVAYTLVLDWHAENSASVVAELRGRSGILAAINLIPTVLFALRNNPLIPILGVSYDTFNLLHRWCARLVVVESLVHTLCWAINDMNVGGLEQIRVSLATSMSYKWGMVGMCAFGVIFISAAGPIRHAFYETFLNGHRLLAVVALVGVYIHLDRAKLPQVPYIQLCFVLWTLEWVWRTFRIVYHNMSRKHGITKVTVEALPAEACRVTFDLARPWRWQPGCHVHVYLPMLSLWSSHPFSIAWAEIPARAALPHEIEISEKLQQVPSAIFNSGTAAKRPSFVTRNSTFSKSSTGNTLTQVAEVTHKADPSNIAIQRDAGVTSISLIMRARSGMTRHLFDRASASPTGIITTWGAIEGPYGGHESLTSYGTVILFAGGVGITHCIGHVRHLMLQYQAGTTSTQRILLVWSVPNTESLEWIRVWMNTILNMEGRRDILRIQLFVTKPRHRTEVVSNTGSVQMFPGRCNPETILKREMQDRIGAMGVTVCGPGAFADSVRGAIREVVEDGCVDFVEEAFTY